MPYSVATTPAPGGSVVARTGLPFTKVYPFTRVEATQRLGGGSAAMAPFVVPGGGTWTRLAATLRATTLLAAELRVHEIDVMIDFNADGSVAWQINGAAMTSGSADAVASWQNVAYGGWRPVGATTGESGAMIGIDPSTRRIGAAGYPAAFASTAMSIFVEWRGALWMV